MYSTHDLIVISAKRHKLSQLFTETMADITRKTVTIPDISHIDLVSILSQLGEKDILITNDEYDIEKCDFQVIEKSGKILLTVSEDGTILNDLDQSEYLDESNCEKLSTIYDTIRYGVENICIVTIGKVA